MDVIKFWFGGDRWRIEIIVVEIQIVEWEEFGKSFNFFLRSRGVGLMIFEGKRLV